MSGYNEVIEWVGNHFDFECNEDINDTFERVDEIWNPEQRFGLADVLLNDLPRFMIWLQVQNDNECEDDTETITFPPERAKVDEELQSEILNTKAEILQARKELSELEDEDDRLQRGGIIDRVKSFIKGIFGG